MNFIFKNEHISKDQRLECLHTLSYLYAINKMSNELSDLHQLCGTHSFDFDQKLRECYIIGKYFFLAVRISYLKYLLIFFFFIIFFFAVEKIQ